MNQLVAYFTLAITLVTLLSIGAYDTFYRVQIEQMQRDLNLVSAEHF